MVVLQFIIISIIILTLHLSVRESRTSREAIRPEIKFLFFFVAGLGRYKTQPTDTASDGSKAENCAGDGKQISFESHCCPWVLSSESDSILSVLCWEPLAN